MEELLFNYINSIVKNIERNGLSRYDPRDTRHMPRLSKKTKISKVLRRIVLLIEELFPIMIRKLLKIKKRVWPTTYTFIGNSYLLIEKMQYPITKNKSAVDIGELCLEEYVAGKNFEDWWQDEENFDLSYAIIKNKNAKPILPMHNLIRCNILLLELGNYYKNEKFKAVSINSIEFVLNKFEIIDFKDGSKSISYYYNTRDSTININTEFAQWLAMIELELHTDKSYEILNSIIRFIIKEQNNDGSWYYFSKWHMNNYGIKPSCDCHHTATVLYNIINILKCNYLEEELYNNLTSALNKGMKYFIDTFFNKDNGEGITIVGYKRPAGPVQYSESILVFCEYMQMENNYDDKIKNEIMDILPMVVNNNIQFIRLRTGEAPSGRVFKWKYIDSIRWGNGPILQSTLQYIYLTKNMTK